jgi:hypothetical protein
MPGAFHLLGKDSFDKEIENDAFVDSPTIEISRMTEENDVVIAEGTVRCRRKTGGFLKVVFCDAFTMQDAKIKRLVTYLVDSNNGCSRRSPERRLIRHLFRNSEQTGWLIRLAESRARVHPDVRSKEKAR